MGKRGSISCESLRPLRPSAEGAPTAASPSNRPVQCHCCRALAINWAREATPSLSRSACQSSPYRRRPRRLWPFTEHEHQPSLVGPPNASVAEPRAPGRGSTSGTWPGQRLRRASASSVRAFQEGVGQCACGLGLALGNHLSRSFVAKSVRATSRKARSRAITPRCRAAMTCSRMRPRCAAC
jgi:hypothetical protein